MNQHTRSGRWLWALIALLAIPWNGHTCQSAQEGARRMQSAEETASHMGKEKLLATLRDTSLRENNPELLIAAIRRLGVMRDSDAIDDLIPLLTFRRLYPEDKDPTAPIDRDHIGTSTHRFPAIEALALIGRPALPALVRVIGASDPETLESRCALETVRWVFLQVTAPDTEHPEDSHLRPRQEAVKFLLQAASEASPAEAAERLGLAAEKLRDQGRYKGPY